MSEAPSNPDIALLTEKIRQFRDERDWMQFHNLKDLSAALAIEAAELQELFLWKTGPEIEAVAETKKERLAEEVADVAIFLLELADILDINLAQAIEQKLEKNAENYPVEKAKGQSNKYTELP